MFYLFLLPFFVFLFHPFSSLSSHFRSSLPPLSSLSSPFRSPIWASNFPSKENGIEGSRSSIFGSLFPSSLTCFFPHSLNFPCYFHMLPFLYSYLNSNRPFLVLVFVLFSSDFILRQLINFYLFLQCQGHIFHHSFHFSLFLFFLWSYTSPADVRPIFPSYSSPSILFPIRSLSFIILPLQARFWLLFSSRDPPLSSPSSLSFYYLPETPFFNNGDHVCPFVWLSFLSFLFFLCFFILYVVAELMPFSSMWLCPSLSCLVLFRAQPKPIPPLKWPSLFHLSLFTPLLTLYCLFLPFLAAVWTPQVELSYFFSFFVSSHSSQCNIATTFLAI